MLCLLHSACNLKDYNVIVILLRFKSTLATKNISVVVEK